MMSDLLGSLINSQVQPYADELEVLGFKIGKLYTDHGLPIDMALDRLPQYSKEQKIAIIHGCCQWFIAHKRDSGATDKAIERQRATNCRILEDFIETDEAGVY